MARVGSGGMTLGQIRGNAPTREAPPLLKDCPSRGSGLRYPVWRECTGLFQQRGKRERFEPQGHGARADPAVSSVGTSNHQSNQQLRKLASEFLDAQEKT